MPPLPEGVLLRRAHASDAPALKRFECRNPGETWTRRVQQDIRRDLPAVAAGTSSSDVNIEVIVAAHHADGLIGVVAFVHAETEINIRALAVTHTWRRKRIGTNLKRAVIDIAAARCAGIVWSNVHKLNKPMLALNNGLHVATDTDPDDPEFKLCIAYIEVAHD